MKFFIIAFTLLFSTCAVARDFFILAVPTVAPWAYTQDDSDQLTGIDIDLLRTISRESGYKFEFKPMSYSRSIQELKKENIDGIAGVSTEYAKIHGFKYIHHPYLENVVQNVYQRADDENIIHKYSQLYTRIVGMIKSFSGAEELNEDPLINKEFSEDPNFLFDKLVNKELDIVVGSDWEASHYLQSRRKPLHYFVPVTFKSGKTIMTDRTIIFSPKVEDGAIRKIDRTVDVLINDKILDNILDSYWEKIHNPVDETSSDNPQEQD